MEVCYNKKWPNSGLAHLVFAHVSPILPYLPKYWMCRFAIYLVLGVTNLYLRAVRLSSLHHHWQPLQKADFSVC